MTPLRRRIVLLGTHGQYNIGDELLLETFLTKLGSDNQYVVNSYDPEHTRRQLGGRFHVGVIHTARNRLRLLKALLGCDVVCFGGGSIIKELYASTGRNRYATMLMILFITIFAHSIARKRIAMLNIGIGPLRTRAGRYLARAILHRVDFLTVRDGMSLRTCQEIGVSAAEVTDAVFSLTAEGLLPREPVARINRADHRIHIVLNLNFDIENPDNWDGFLESLGTALLAVGERWPISIHGLPMQIGFKRVDDREALRAFSARFPTLDFEIHSPTTAAEAAALINESDVVVAERFHAIVIAAILGVPAYALAYDVKVRELVGVLDTAAWTTDINQPIDPAVLADALCALVAQREKAGAHARERASTLHHHAIMNFAHARDWLIHALTASPNISR